jgi:ankyrin repeat protein
MNRRISLIVRGFPVALSALLLAGCGDIRSAAREGDLEKVNMYVAKGVDVNETSGDGETALHWACRQGHEDIARYLLEKGADMSAQGTGCGTPLQWAVRAGRPEMASLLLEHGADVNRHGTDGFTALHDAVLNRDLPMVRLLLTAGADPNAKASYDRTPLMLDERDAPDKAVADLLRRHGAGKGDVATGAGGEGGR